MIWISVDDKLPDASQLVIVSTEKGVGVARYDKFNGFNSIILNGNTQYSRLAVTHWVPLPLAP